jgi:transcriptional regulator with XRE-family HTH domain
MIRSGIEYRNAKKQIENLRFELDELLPSAETSEILQGVVSALRLKIADIEHELSEYENLKARIARGWNQTDLARALGVEPPQIQRYERNDWQKISAWRLQEVIEALDLQLNIHARLREHRVPGALWFKESPFDSRDFEVAYSDQALTSEKKDKEPPEDRPVKAPTLSPVMSGNLASS